MKNNICRAFIAAFLVLCLMPLAALPIVGEAEPAANELPLARPALWDEDGLNTDYCAELTDYLASRFAFRQELVTVWSALNAGLFSSSAQEELILGRRGWLFYSETLEDYMGLGLSDGQLQNAANDLALIQEYLETQDIDLVFAVAPNKNSLYPQYMPGRIRAGRAASNAVRLAGLLRERGVCSADLFSAFEGGEPLYYASDSHWNSQGAALAADVILAALGRESAYSSADFSPGAEHQGDLFEMLYPALRDRERDMDSGLDFSYNCLKDPAEGNAMSIQTENPQGAGSLLCFRDSFGVALYPYLAQSFETARFSRAAAYDLSGVADEGVDAVVIELVERNLDYLLEKAPCFPAPLREAEAVAGEGLAQAERSGEDGAGLVQTLGLLPGSLCDEGSRVYLRAGDRVYEAWVLTAEDDEGTAFSAWLDKDITAEEALCMSGGRLTAYKIEWK